MTPGVVDAAKDLKYGPIVAIVNSNSEPNKKYEVRKKHDGTLSCQCMGWRFSKDVPRKCKHTSAVLGQGKVRPMTAAAVAASRTAPGPTIREEATRIAKELVQRGRTLTVDYATQQIEAAIKKFMGSLTPVSALEPALETDSGVRMITLDD